MTEHCQVDGGGREKETEAEPSAIYLRLYDYNKVYLPVA
jgi:hypothetical protein